MKLNQNKYIRFGDRHTLQVDYLSIYEKSSRKTIPNMVPEAIDFTMFKALEINARCSTRQYPKIKSSGTHVFTQ